MNLSKTLKSFNYAIRGIRTLVRTENNFKIHVLSVVLVIISGITLRINKREWLIIVLLIGSVLIAEAFNTAIEKLCDFVHPEFHERIGEIKDLAAAGVLLAAIIAFVGGLLIFAPKIWMFI